MKESKMGFEDLLLNESFIRYVLGKSRTDTDHWNSFIKKQPEFTDQVLQAREMIIFIASHHTQPKNSELGVKVLNQLQQQIIAEQQPINIKSGKASLRIYWYAASVLLLTGMSLFFLLIKRHSVDILHNEFLEVIVPEGQRSQLILPDGSKLWLNSGTHFKYPADFLTTSRDVYLSGEAFFEVTHNQNNMPFTVHLKEGLFVRVLGTEFNVKSYDSEKVIETTLVKGSIHLVKEGSNNQIVQELNLKPNEKAVYRKESQELNITNLALKSAEKHNPTKESASVKMEMELTEIEAVTAWKNEELVFHDKTFEDIAVLMGRWFGTTITINDDSLRKERFTGKFVNNESIYQILDIFNRSESIQYVTKNKEIIIKRKNRYKP